MARPARSSGKLADARNARRAQPGAVRGRQARHPGLDVEPEGRQGGHRRHRRAEPEGAALHDLLRDGAPADHQPRRQPGLRQRQRSDRLRDWRCPDRQDAQARGASRRRVEGKGLQPRHRDDAGRERDLGRRPGQRRVAGLGQSGRRPQPGLQPVQDHQADGGRRAQLDRR